MQKEINKEDLQRYQKNLNILGVTFGFGLLNEVIPEPYNSQLKNTTDLHEKSLLLEKVVAEIV
ncbi:MAG: hypothetical protein E7390_09325 [Ruminococcaceae bacterium]|nr:hypothetical protein [Oscillospiraceae bacterium]